MLNLVRKDKKHLSCCNDAAMAGRCHRAILWQ
jgi:hypothetical protein